TFLKLLKGCYTNISRLYLTISMNTLEKIRTVDFWITRTKIIVFTIAHLLMALKMPMMK
ncbi:hypothetical protein L9F63_021645, partial [Diploptera punctata]